MKDRKKEEWKTEGKGRAMRRYEEALTKSCEAKMFGGKSVRRMVEEVLRQMSVARKVAKDRCLRKVGKDL